CCAATACARELARIVCPQAAYHGNGAGVKAVETFRGEVGGGPLAYGDLASDRGRVVERCIRRDRIAENRLSEYGDCWQRATKASITVKIALRSVHPDNFPSDTSGGHHPQHAFTRRRPVTIGHAETVV